MREYTIAAIPGDGIGVEVIAAGLKVLGVVAGRDGGFRLKVEHLPWSSAYYLRHGHYIPEEHLGEKEAALRLMRAVETVTGRRIHTPRPGWGSHYRDRHRGGMRRALEPTAQVFGHRAPAIQ
ncbi:MAG TPA: isocitrate/isopropylmalate family dehydrogenase [Burkholderiales bacterium]|nr:isocitrate/isopropylmalate family dehydrogenase [Burkholderiales bacterium]